MTTEVMAEVKPMIIALITTIVLDTVWLGAVVSPYYESRLSHFLRLKENGKMNPILWAGMVVYLLIPFGVVHFVLPKLPDADFTIPALVNGFLFGVVIYGIYNFSNYALLRNWPLSVTLMDSAWGGILCALVTLVTKL